MSQQVIIEEKKTLNDIDNQIENETNFLLWICLYTQLKIAQSLWYTFILYVKFWGLSCFSMHNTSDFSQNVYSKSIN